MTSRRMIAVFEDFIIYQSNGYEAKRIVLDLRRTFLNMRNEEESTCIRGLRQSTTRRKMKGRICEERLDTYCG